MRSLLLWSPLSGEQDSGHGRKRSLVGTGGGCPGEEGPLSQQLWVPPSSALPFCVAKRRAEHRSLPSSLGFFMRRYNQMAKGLGLSQAAHSQAAFSDDCRSDLGLNLPFLFCTVEPTLAAPSQSCCKHEAQCPPSVFILIEVQLVYSAVLSSAVSTGTQL